MKSINSLDITRLRVEEDFGFQKRIESETALLTEETDKPMVDAFKAAVAAFDAALKASTRNSQFSAAKNTDACTTCCKTSPLWVSPNRNKSISTHLSDNGCHVHLLLSGQTNE